MSTMEQMRDKLSALSPESMEILDESAKHAGHEGAKSGGGHYWLTIVSPRFAGQGTLARHRLVYEALGDMMHKEIHALSIKAYTPDEI
jgi:BolA protein